ncbi:hypothetical protein D8674_010047 [Pyrus ussuriensis x Pyrus communis]|uniref:RNase H type-1 domain-containing protein n=1 Tax=Pyrus ussuriensis x Pyrus communis TaxID=2448454 RepID=A0A5N5F9M8_9ROSA|nr:hypothetical protein D8674_010047 [Pyrus ussuriensis x Pyrus communis]
MIQRLAGISSPLLAEMMAARVAMLFARDLEAACVEFAGDAQMVITALQQNSEDDISRLGHVIDDARHFLHSIPRDCLSLNRRLTGLHTVWFGWIFLWMDKCFGLRNLILSLILYLRKV